VPDFWKHSGYQLLERDAHGHLAVTDDFLRAYLCRPEIRPIEESCGPERELHARLLECPRALVSEGELARLADPDARDNYRIVLRFFERLISSGTIESCYSGLFAGGDVSVPPLFVDQLVHVVARGILEGTSDPLEARAAELLFRAQRATLKDGHILLADGETVEARLSGAPYGNLGKLLAKAQVPVAGDSLEVLDDSNAADYWGRDERHEFVFSLNHNHSGVHALCRVLQKWIRHFLGVEVSIKSINAIEERYWAWHIGLDPESNAILNEIWRGAAVESDRLARLLALFQLNFASSSDSRPDIAGRPVYLGIAMTVDGVVKIKPQNLLINLPLARFS